MWELLWACSGRHVFVCMDGCGVCVCACERVFRFIPRGVPVRMRQGGHMPYPRSLAAMHALTCSRAPIHSASVCVYMVCVCVCVCVCVWFCVVVTRLVVLSSKAPSANVQFA